MAQEHRSINVPVNRFLISKSRHHLLNSAFFPVYTEQFKALSVNFSICTVLFFFSIPKTAFLLISVFLVDFRLSLYNIQFPQNCIMHVIVSLKTVKQTLIVGRLSDGKYVSHRQAAEGKQKETLISLMSRYQIESADCCATPDTRSRPPIQLVGCQLEETLVGLGVVTAYLLLWFLFSLGAFQAVTCM